MTGLSTTPSKTIIVLFIPKDFADSKSHKSLIGAQHRKLYVSDSPQFYPPITNLQDSSEIDSEFHLTMRSTIVKTETAKYKMPQFE